MVFCVVVFHYCCCLVPNSCLILCDPMDHSLPGSSVHGILQTRILEWVAIPFSSGSFQSRDQTHVFCIAGRLPSEPHTWTTLKKWLQRPSTFSVLFCLVFNHLIEEFWVHINFSPSTPLPDPAPPQVFFCQELSATVLWWISYFDSKVLVFLTKQDFSLLLKVL